MAIRARLAALKCVLDPSVQFSTTDEELDEPPAPDADATASADPLDGLGQVLSNKGKLISAAMIAAEVFQIMQSAGIDIENASIAAGNIVDSCAQDLEWDA